MDRKILLLLPLLSVQCTGTETENPAAPPLISFQGSPCKNTLSISAKGVAPAPDGGTPANQKLLLDKSYDGLQCIAWQKLAEGSFRFEFGNFYDSCGIEHWKGAANVENDGKVTLHVINSGCLAAACLGCLYDWDFDVRGVPETEDARLALSVEDDDGRLCQSSRPPIEVTLPTSDAAQGIQCRPAYRTPVQQQAYAHGTEGQLNMPCGPEVQTPCAAELSCGPLASPDDLRCLARCSIDSDCPLSGALACQEGTCRLAQTW